MWNVSQILSVSGGDEVFVGAEVDLGSMSTYTELKEHEARRSYET